jgi:hypothetical protein
MMADYDSPVDADNLSRAEHVVAQTRALAQQMSVLREGPIQRTSYCTVVDESGDVIVGWHLDEHGIVRDGMPVASDGPAAWIQPTGAHDAYPIGAVVTHAGQAWASITADNIWAPGVFGWEINSAD